MPGRRALRARSCPSTSSAGGPGGEQLLIDLPHLGDPARPCPPLPNLSPGGASKPGSQQGVVEQSREGGGQGAAIAGWEEEASPFRLQDFGRPADRGGGDRQPVEHAFEDHHAERLVAARHHQHVGAGIPGRKLVGSQPAGEMDAVAAGFQAGREPLPSDFVARAWRRPPRQHETTSRCSRQHQRHGVKQLADAFALDQAAAVEDERLGGRARFSRCGAGKRQIVDAVADDPDPAVSFRIIGGEESPLALGDRDQPVGRPDCRLLNGSLRQPGVQLETQVVFGAIHRMYVIDERRASARFQFACDRPEQRRVEVEDVGPQMRHEGEPRLDRVGRGTAEKAYPFPVDDLAPVAWLPPHRGAVAVGRALDQQRPLDQEDADADAAAGAAVHPAADRSAQPAVDDGRELRGQVENAHRISVRAS